jgi:hypothetical protein
LGNSVPSQEFKNDPSNQTDITDKNDNEDSGPRLKM